ncbi:MAG: M43 family zinc metalloprotease [Ginsengibacter sp.]
MAIFICPIVSKAQQRLPQPFIDSSAFSQKKAGNICGNDMMLYKLRQKVNYRAKEDEMNHQILNALGSLAPDTLILPVVIHIINPSPYSITDFQVINGVKLLNDAYSKSGVYAASAGADTKIRFCLAQKDPGGGNTTGITRTTSYFSNHVNMDIEDAKLKNLIQWDPSRYINIWLVTEINAEAYADFSCGTWYRLGVGGYATLPPLGGSLDGIVITSFGTLLAHEMGHYLGLYHTFEGGCYNYNCQTDGDRVCDTPPDGTVRPSAGCASPTNSCNTDTLSAYSNGFFHTDVPDQIANFMDYGNSACSNQFTQGQADRMKASVITQRPGLLVAECTKPCTDKIIADFTRSINYSIVGNTINFTNTSTGATKFEWSLNDVLTATTTDFSYTFNAAGKDKISLKAFNTPGCFAATFGYVITSCGTTARFYTDKKAIASKAGIYTDSIVFTNNSYNGFSYQWLIGNDQGMGEHVESTKTNLTYVFPTPGNYKIRLVATNGSCSDTTDYYTLTVMDPTADGVPFSVSLLCYGSNKVKVSFCLADYGFAPIPKNTPVTFYDADPRMPGANKLSPTMYLPSSVPGGNCYNCFSHILNVSYRGLEKVYLSFNDSGKVSPLVFPNTSFIETNYANNTIYTQTLRTTVSSFICQGQKYYGHTTSGTYIDTLASVLNGCDSIRTLILTVKPVVATSVTTSICNGQNYAGHTSSGTYVDVYLAANGCDSTRTLQLTVKPVSKTSLSISVCEGQSYFGHTQSGTYVDTYFATNGCDSIRTVYLNVKVIARKNIIDTICNGENYAGHTTSGTFTDTYNGVNGCDSVRTLQLTVNPVFKTTVSTAICNGQKYAGHTLSGIYIDNYKAFNGCDSTRTLNLTVNPLKFSSITTEICQGENYAGHTKSGKYVDVYPTYLGCDSTRTLYLTVKPTRSSNVNAVICDGDNYAGHIITGNYVDVYTATNGCDSTRNLTLTVKARSFKGVNASICEGASYRAGGHLQTITGIYSDTLLNAVGCDSIITTQLTVNPLPKPNLGEDRGVCIGDKISLDPGSFVSYKWQDGSINNTFTTNTVGRYSVLVSDNFGCKASDTMFVLRIDPLPRNFLRSDTSLCRGNVVSLNVRGYKDYMWSTGSTMPTIDVINAGTYLLNVTDLNGCKGIDSVKIDYYKCATLWLPNAFTPNRDGLNEVFKPTFPAPVKNYKMQIWNRNGNQVFETTNYLMGWDGQFRSELQPIGVYVYVISFTDIDGKETMKKGIVTLVR